jgi:hypothetical protein
VQVRVFMLLGMLVGRRPDAQVQLASIPGAARGLVLVMRTSADGDAKALAQKLFGLLVSNADAKVKAEADLRRDTSDDPDNFVG